MTNFKLELSKDNQYTMLVRQKKESVSNYVVGGLIMLGFASLMTYTLIMMIA